MKRSCERGCAVGLAFSLILLMMVEYLRRIEFTNGTIQSLQADLIGAVLSKSSQTPIIVALLAYFVALLWIEIRNRPAGAPPIRFWKRLAAAHVCKAALVVFSLTACWRAWRNGAEADVHDLQLGIEQTTNALVLLTGLVASCATEVLASSGVDAARTFQRVILVMVPLFLAATSFAHPEVPHVYKYHGAIRWTGLWVNPNTYGLLMGVAITLAIPQAMLGVKSVWRIRPAVPTRQWLLQLLWVSAVVLCAFGLLMSYSRGAWLATVCGLAFLVWGCAPARIRRNLIPFALALASLFVLTFWQFRFTDVTLARRAFSVGNVNDFSWRNRVTVWGGSARMLKDYSVFGVGWGRVETVYAKSYRAPQLEETLAIQLNDFFTLGISAGVPALICFAAYVGFSLFSNARKGRPPAFGVRWPMPSQSDSEATEDCWLVQATRAACVLLLVGFWIDGGLFRLATGPLFWVLAELSRSGNMPTRSQSRSKPPSPDLRGLRKGEIALRWTAGLLVVLATLQTAFQLLFPCLGANTRTLAITRKCLLQRDEIKDFDYLSANPVWRGKRIATLMEHIRLARYNRELVPWHMNDQSFHAFVLSPQIDPAVDGQMNWRRPLWEFLYPRIRHETHETTAAGIVVRLLRERVTIRSTIPPGQTISDIWSAEITDAQGFERICVAALRSVGVPARLDLRGKAEFYANGEWRNGLRPSILEVSPRGY